MHLPRLRIFENLGKPQSFVRPPQEVGIVMDGSCNEVRNTVGEENVVAYRVGDLCSDYLSVLIHGRRGILETNHPGLCGKRGSPVHDPESLPWENIAQEKNYAKEAAVVEKWHRNWPLSSWPWHILSTSTEMAWLLRLGPITSLLLGNDKSAP